MSAVDDRIVEMKFQNTQFEKGANTTMGTLDKLKSKLNFTGATKGINDLQQAGNKFSLANMGQGIAGMAGKFGALSVAGITALANITSKAVDTGLQLVKSLSLDPILDGFHEYETNLGAIQTVLANTQSDGTNLQDVNAALNELNTYSDKTIYNFTEMAKNIGTFTAAGVKLKPATAAIKGIANLAALSGSTSEQASTAMYQLSQAIASNKVGLQDWNSVVNAGMGGKVFQKALFNTAKAMGTIKGVKMDETFEQWTKRGNSFRDSLKDGWITGEVLTNTLNTFTGDLTDAQLKQMGYSAEQIKAIQAQAKAASDAATKVKSLTQLMDTLKEAVGSGWTQSFQLIFGDFNQAKDLFTGVNNALSPIIQNSANARNKILKDWQKFGGRSALIKSIANVFKFLMNVMGNVHEAFTDIFPPLTGKRLAEISKAILAFTKGLTLSEHQSARLSQTFRGVFAVLDIVWQVIKGVAGALGDLIGYVSKGSGDILDFTGSLGYMLVKLDHAVKTSEGFKNFFKVLGKILIAPIAGLKLLGSVIETLWAKFVSKSPDKAADALGRVKDRLAPLASLGKIFIGVWRVMTAIFKAIARVAAPIIQGLGTALGHLGEVIANAFSTGDFKPVFDALNTGLLAGILITVKKFLDKGINIDVGSGLFGSIKETFETLTGSLKAMQQQIQAKTLLLIAGAVALLTVSIVALSLIDSKKLTKALAAITVGFTQLLAAMAVLEKISKSAGFIKMPIIAASMVILATSILVLSAAIVILSRLSWEQLAKGLTGVAGGLILMLAALKIMNTVSPKTLLTASALLLMATSLVVLAAAVKIFSTMSWAEMAKGLVGVGGGLAIMIAALALLPKTSIVSAASLVIASTALLILSKALKAMGDMKWESIAKALVLLAGSLVLLAAAMIVMTEGLPGAAAMLVAAAAILVLAPALKMIGDMKWESIAKALVALAGSLVLIAAATIVMSGAIPGAIALQIVTAALALLAPVLKVLGGMPWTEIAKGLVTLAGTFVVLGAAGLLLGPLIPAILGLAAAVALFGAGLALAGAGVLAFSIGLTGLAVSGAAAGVALTAIVTGLLNLLPLAAQKVGEAIISLATTIATGGPQILAAIITVLGALLDAIIKVSPKIGQAMNALVRLLVQVLTKNVPALAAAGLALLIALLNKIDANIGKVSATATDIIAHFLQGIANNIGKVITAGTNIIIAFIKGVGDNSIRVTNAAADTIIKFVNGLADSIRSHQYEMQSAGANLAGAILDGMTGGLWSGSWRVLNAAAGVARSALNAAMSALGINSPSKEFWALGEYSDEGMAGGFDSKSKMVERSAEGVANKALNTVRKSMSAISDAFDSNVDVNPTITPVLDLSQMRKDAAQIDGVIKPKPIAPISSVQTASSLSLTERANAAARSELELKAAEPSTSVEFNQYNSSPKSLSEIEIYRQTKNLMSGAKGVLGGS